MVHVCNTMYICIIQCICNTYHMYACIYECIYNTRYYSYSYLTIFGEDCV